MLIMISSIFNQNRDSSFGKSFMRFPTTHFENHRKRSRFHRLFFKHDKDI